MPDLVVDLQGQVETELVGRIDSIKGVVRTIFDGAPDAPVTKLIVQMQGGKKGLIVNSRNLCKSKNRAKVSMVGQNGRRYDTRPVVKADCGKKKRVARKRR